MLTLSEKKFNKKRKRRPSKGKQSRLGGMDKFKWWQTVPSANKHSTISPKRCEKKKTGAKSTTLNTKESKNDRRTDETENEHGHYISGQVPTRSNLRFIAIRRGNLATKMFRRKREKKGVSL